MKTESGNVLDDDFLPDAGLEYEDVAESLETRARQRRYTELRRRVELKLERKRLREEFGGFDDEDWDWDNI